MPASQEPAPRLRDRVTRAEIETLKGEIAEQLGVFRRDTTLILAIVAVIAVIAALCLVWHA